MKSSNVRTVLIAVALVAMPAAAALAQTAQTAAGSDPGSQVVITAVGGIIAGIVLWAIGIPVPLG